MAKKPANQTPPRTFEEALAELERILGEIEKSAEDATDVVRITLG